MGTRNDDGDGSPMTGQRSHDRHSNCRSNDLSGSNDAISKGDCSTSGTWRWSPSSLAVCLGLCLLLYHGSPICRLMEGMEDDLPGWIWPWPLQGYQPRIQTPTDWL